MWPDSTGRSSDRQFVCPQLIGNDDLSASMHVYAYEFADATAPPYIPLLPGCPPVRHTPPNSPTCSDLAAKPIDIAGDPAPRTGTQLTLGDEMIDAWTGFARTGKLDAPRRTPQSRVAVAFGSDTPTSAPSTAHRCPFSAAEIG